MIKVYTIYQYKNHGNIDDISIIKEGFNFVAFFFPFIWMLFNKLWTIILIYSLTNLFFIGIKNYYIINNLQYILLILVNHFFIGVTGNDYIRKNLRNLGYEMTKIVIGRNKDEALLNFLDKSDKL